MAFVRPTLAKLISRAKSDIETRLPGADAQLRRTVENVLARVVAGAAHGLHGHLVWAARQLMPDTAVDELMVRWASIWGLERVPATKATGTVSITGVTSTICPADTLWQTGDGIIYVQDADVTISAGVGTIAVTAQEAGADGNQDAGVALTLVNAVAGIDSDGTVDAGGLDDGFDQESLEDLLDRLLLRLQTPPSGGGPGDYERWALEVPGCTRAWQRANANGAGTVALYFVQDNDPSTIIPDAGEVAAMQTYIDDRAPVTADPTVYAPVAKLLDMTITITPDTVAVREAAVAELEDLLLREGEPGGTIYLSQLNEAISIAPGEIDHTIISPVADVTHAGNEIPILGTITWV